jgi:3-oxoacyl-[acyl-carrier protein] reductase
MTIQRDLIGKAALITGGSRGIGAGIAKTLAARGANVAITYATNRKAADDVVAEIQALGGNALAVEADLSKASTAMQGALLAVDQLGHLDILVNNAGVAPHGMITSMTAADFERIIDTNVRGLWHTTSAVANVIAHGGRIINIGSFFSERVPFPGASAYGLSKHAVAGMTRGWARDFASRQITVNSVQPGPIATETNPDQGERAERIKTMVPLGRFGRPDEIGALVAFLASAEAAYITGAHIQIDGGLLA